MVTRWKPILPGKFRPEVFREELSSTVKSTSRAIYKDFLKTISTWDHKPKFREVFMTSVNEIGVLVRTAPISGRKPPELIYYFLNNGTRARFAKMTPDFIPKTTPGVIGSGPGRGGLQAVTPLIDWGPIEARKWDVAIAKKHRSRFVKSGRAALANAAVRSGHGR